MSDNHECYENSDSEKIARVQTSYLKARKEQEMVEVELKRSKIIIMDADGKKIRIPLLREH